MKFEKKRINIGIIYCYYYYNYLPGTTIHAINSRISEIICFLGFNILNDPLRAALINVTIRGKKKIVL